MFLQLFFCTIHRKTPVLETHCKLRFQNRCFPVNFAKFSRSQNTSGRPVLSTPGYRHVWNPLTTKWKISEYGVLFCSVFSHIRKFQSSKLCMTFCWWESNRRTWFQSTFSTLFFSTSILKFNSRLTIFNSSKPWWENATFIIGIYIFLKWPTTHCKLMLHFFHSSWQRLKAYSRWQGFSICHHYINVPEVHLFLLQPI